MLRFLKEFFAEFVVTPIRNWDLAVQEEGVRQDISGMRYWPRDESAFSEEGQNFIERTVRSGRAAIEPLFSAIENNGPRPLFFDALTQLAKRNDLGTLIADRIDMWSQNQNEVPEPMFNLLIGISLASEDLADILERMLFGHPERCEQIAPKLGELTELNIDRFDRIAKRCESPTPSDRPSAAQVLAHVPLTKKSQDPQRALITVIATTGKDEKVRAILLVNCSFLAMRAMEALNGSDDSLHVRVAIARSIFNPKFNATITFLPYIVSAMVGASADATADATKFVVEELDFRAVDPLFEIACKPDGKVEVIGIAITLLAAIYAKSKEIQQERDYYAERVDDRVAILVKAFDRVPTEHGPALAKLLANTQNAWPLLVAMKSSVGGSVYLGTIFAVVCQRDRPFLQELVDATQMPLDEYVAAAAMLALSQGELEGADKCAQQILARPTVSPRVRLAAVIHVAKTTNAVLMVLEVLKEALTSGDSLMFYIAQSFVLSKLRGQSVFDHPTTLAEAA